MARQVTMHEAFDGTVFKTLKECTDYEKKLEDEIKIRSFLESPANPYVKDAHRTVAEKTLLLFCEYQRNGGLEDVEATVVEEEDDG